MRTSSRHGNDLHGQPQSGLALTTDRRDRANQACEVNGQERCMLRLPKPEVFHLQELTLSVWIAGNSPKLWARVLDQFIYTEKQGYNLFYVHTTGQLAFNAWLQDHSLLKLITKTKVSSDWQHVLVTYNGKIAKLFVNGELECTQEKAGLIRFADKAFVIGNGYDGNHYFPWCGKIDDVCIYDRPLNPKEIQALYSGKESATGTTKYKLQDLRNVDAF